MIDKERLDEALTVENETPKKKGGGLFVASIIFTVITLALFIFYAILFVGEVAAYFDVLAGDSLAMLGVALVFVYSILVGVPALVSALIGMILARVAEKRLDGTKRVVATVIKFINLASMALVVFSGVMFYLIAILPNSAD